MGDHSLRRWPMVSYFGGGGETRWLDANMRWLDPWYKGCLAHPVIIIIKLNSFELSLNFSQVIGTLRLVLVRYVPI
jgi:hypothetical protein